MKKGLLKVHANVIQNIYERASTRVKGLCGETEDFFFFSRCYSSINRTT